MDDEDEGLGGRELPPVEDDGSFGAVPLLDGEWDEEGWGMRNLGKRLEGLERRVPPCPCQVVLLDEDEPVPPEIDAERDFIIRLVAPGVGADGRAIEDE